MSTANVVVVSPDIRSERRIDLHWTVQQLKEKLETVTGIAAGAQSIHVFETEDAASTCTPSASGVELADEEKPVGFYGVTQGKVLKVSDTSPPGVSLTGQFTDVSQVEKFEISQQEYAARQDTVLAYKQRNKLGRFAESSGTSNPTTSESALAQIIAAYQLGARCEVDHGDGSDSEILKKRGTVRFVGTTSFGTGAGVWVGVEYDEPVGKNDGSVQGKRYFTCRPSYGGFVRPEKLRVGDFPPLDLELEDEEI